MVGQPVPRYAANPGVSPRPHGGAFPLRDFGSQRTCYSVDVGIRMLPDLTSVDLAPPVTFTIVGCIFFLTSF